MNAPALPPSEAFVDQIMRDEHRRRRIREAVDTRLVELMAADLFAKMHPEAEPTEEATE